MAGLIPHDLCFQERIENQVAVPAPAHHRPFIVANSIAINLGCPTFVIFHQYFIVLPPNLFKVHFDNIFNYLSASFQFIMHQYFSVAVTLHLISLQVQLLFILVRHLRRLSLSEYPLTLIQLLYLVVVPQFLFIIFHFRRYSPMYLFSPPIVLNCILD